MALYANLVPLSICLQFLDRFIMFGEKGVLSVLQRVFKDRKKVLLGMSDPFELQIYLTKQMYVDAAE